MCYITRVRTKEYKDFSWKLHEKAGRKPIVAQMEITYGCPLHCRHCYTDCYNNQENKQKELSTGKVKRVLYKCKEAKTVWLCLTGGDPLTRRDFPEIYKYAKKLGFIINVFSSLTCVNKEILELFKKQPPFGIETTLSAATPETYKRVTGTSLFRKQIESIKKLTASNIEVRVKTQVTRLNIGEIDKIKSLVRSLGMDFRPSTMLFAGLNHDTAPCDLRLEPEDAIRVNKGYGYYDEEIQPPGHKLKLEDMITGPFDKLFSCATGGHAFQISPRGEMFLCSCLRKPDYDLLEKGATVQKGFESLNKKVHSMKFKTGSICRRCKYRMICKWCPGRAVLEKGALEEPIEYFCCLTTEILRQHEKEKVEI
ncbi:MAG: radical SAM protein [Candidatus Omnitrophota bacterium]